MTIRYVMEPDGGELAVGDIREFFRRRTWYELAGGEVEYFDEDTGVRFRIRWAASDDTLESIELVMQGPRARFFALEAAGELEALVTEFGIVPENGANDGDGGAEFDTEAFLDHWYATNLKLLQQLGSASEREFFRADEGTLRNAWRWNRARAEYQTVLGEGIFVPVLRFLVRNGAVERGCVWPETIPFALPRAADLVLVSGIEHKGLASDESSELRIAQADRIGELTVSHADEHEKRSDPTDHVLVGWNRPPEEMLRELREIGNPADDCDLEMLSSDRLLDADLAG